MPSPEELVSSSCLHAHLKNLCSVEPFLSPLSTGSLSPTPLRALRVSSWRPQSSGLGLSQVFSCVQSLFGI